MHLEPGLAELAPHRLETCTREPVLVECWRWLCVNGRLLRRDKEGERQRERVATGARRQGPGLPWQKQKCTTVPDVVMESRFSAPSLSPSCPSSILIRNTRRHLWAYDAVLGKSGSRRRIPRAVDGEEKTRKVTSQEEDSRAEAAGRARANPVFGVNNKNKKKIPLQQDQFYVIAWFRFLVWPVFFASLFLPTTRRQSAWRLVWSGGRECTRKKGAGETGFANEICTSFDLGRTLL